MQIEIAIDPLKNVGTRYTMLVMDHDRPREAVQGIVRDAVDVHVCDEWVGRRLRLVRVVQRYGPLRDEQFISHQDTRRLNGDIPTYGGQPVDAMLEEGVELEFPREGLRSTDDRVLPSPGTRRQSRMLEARCPPAGFRLSKTCESFVHVNGRGNGTFWGCKLFLSIELQRKREHVKHTIVPDEIKRHARAGDIGASAEDGKIGTNIVTPSFPVAQFNLVGFENAPGVSMRPLEKFGMII